MTFKSFLVTVFLFLLLGLAGCSTSPRAPVTESGPEAVADRAFANRDYTRAAQIWQQEALEVEAAQAGAYRVRAADAWLLANQPGPAKDLLKWISRDDLDNGDRARLDLVLADWTSEEHHQAFEGMLNGGIAGALLDCHSNWAAAWHLMRRDGLERPPVTVTARFDVKLLRPTQALVPLHLEARVTESDGAKVRVDATLACDGVTTATCAGLFVAVEPGHPAHHAW